MTKYRRPQAADGCIFIYDLCTSPWQPVCDHIPLGENQLGSHIKSYNIFLDFCLLSGVGPVEGLGFTHCTIGSASSASICSCMPSLSGLHVGDTSALQILCKEQRQSNFLVLSPQICALTVKNGSTLVLGS